MSGTNHTNKGEDPGVASGSTKQKTITVDIDPGPAFRSFGGNADAIAKMMWAEACSVEVRQDARSVKVRLARRDLTKALLTERRLCVEAGPTLLKAKIPSRRGHIAFVASEITVDDAESLVHGELLCRMMLEAFPQGCLIFDREWRQKMKGQENKPAYVAKHQAAIKIAAMIYLNTGGTLAGCGAKLGNHSIVVIGSVKSYHEDGIMHCSMTIGAEKTHPLVGINCWNFAYDPRRPNKIFFHNWLIGKHPIPLMDRLNIKIGSGLMSTMYRTIPYAIQAGVRDLETFLEGNCIHLYRERAWYRVLDTLSPLPIRMKGVVGQTFDAETYDEKILKQRVRTFKFRVLCLRLRFTREHTVRIL